MYWYLKHLSLAAEKQAVRAFTSDRWVRGEGAKMVFLEIREWQNQDSCCWLNPHSMEYYPQQLVFVCLFCEGLGKSGSLSLYPVPGGKFSHALSEYYLDHQRNITYSNHVCWCLSLSIIVPLAKQACRLRSNFAGSYCCFEDVALYIKYNESLLNKFILHWHDCIYVLPWAPWLSDILTDKKCRVL